MKAKDYDREFDNHGGLCVRLHDRQGNHKASLLPCGFDEDGNNSSWDLVLPDGDVIYCGIDSELVDVFVELFGWERITPLREAERS